MKKFFLLVLIILSSCGPVHPKKIYIDTFPTKVQLQSHYNLTEKKLSESSWSPGVTFKAIIPDRVHLNPHVSGAKATLSFGDFSCSYSDDRVYIFQDAQPKPTVENSPSEYLLLAVCSKEIPKDKEVLATSMSFKLDESSLSSQTVGTVEVEVEPVL